MEKALIVVSVLLIVIGLYLIIRPYIRSKNDKQEVGHSTKR